MPSLADRVYVVTGAGGAIATPIVHALAHAGAKLALVDRTAKAEPAKSLGALAVAADLTTTAGATTMAATVAEHFGRIDGLIHTVGAFAMGNLVDSDGATYDRMFDANVRALFNVLCAVVPGMVARGDGFVCGFSSEPGWTGRAPGSALYGAAKSAATSLLRSLDVEVRNSQVGVCIVFPMGVVDTPANRREMAGADPKTWIDPEEIAASIVHAATRGPRGRLSDLPIHPPR